MANIKDQPPQVQKLYHWATGAMRWSQPYKSGVHVGAAARVFGNNGPIQGFNIEISEGDGGRAYNDGIHAEHVLLADARKRAKMYGVQEQKILEEILVVGNVPGPIAPCGSCLDWMIGYAVNRYIPVHMTNDQGVYAVNTLGELLPLHAELVRAGRSVQDDGFRFEARAYHREAREILESQNVFGADRIRAAIIIGAGKVSMGGTHSSDAYHGTPALLNALAIASTRAEQGTLTALVFNEDLKLELPFGIERQELFQLAGNRGQPIKVYYEHEGTVYRTDSTALMPCGFYIVR